MVKGYTKQNVISFVLHGLVYTHPSMAANLLCPPGSSLSPEVLTSFVLPIHNQGVSSAPLQGLALWNIFLPTTGSFFVFLITNLLPASALYQRTLPAAFCIFLDCFFLSSRKIFCWSLYVSKHLNRIIYHTFCQHGIEYPYHLSCDCH